MAVDDVDAGQRHMHPLPGHSESGGHLTDGQALLNNRPDDDPRLRHAPESSTITRLTGPGTPLTITRLRCQRCRDARHPQLHQYFWGL